MQIIIGTKREITVMQWREVLEKHMERANNSMECFRRFSEASDLEHLVEDCEKLLETAKNAQKAVEYMDSQGIR